MQNFFVYFYSKTIIQNFLSSNEQRAKSNQQQAKTNEQRATSKNFHLDISKAFDKFWHEGLIFKLKQNDISNELLHILSDFFKQ